jgi:hypothetical protein
LTHFLLIDVDADDFLRAILCKVLVIGAGSVRVGLIMLRLEVEVLGVIPDASVKVVIHAKSLRMRFVRLLLFTLLYLDFFRLDLIAVLLHSCVVSLNTRSFCLFLLDRLQNFLLFGLL